MRTLPPLPTIRDLLRLYQIRATKHLSQNFIMNPALCSRIVRSCGPVADGHVIEVGAGPGNLTRPLLEADTRHVTVVERDARFLPSLQLLQRAAPNRLSIVLGDILTYDMSSGSIHVPSTGWEDPPPNLHIIGNLPFNVSTSLIIRWLKQISERANVWSRGRARMTLTFQKEVAERLAAGPAATDEELPDNRLKTQRCRLSIMAQNWCRVEHRYDIPGKAFTPKPDVDVGVVVFTPLIRPVIDHPFSLIEKLTRHVFSMRQKYCVRGASMLYPEPLRDELTQLMFELADVEATLRPFQLTLEHFRRLCDAYKEILRLQPSVENYEMRSDGKHGGAEYLDMDRWQEWRKEIMV